MCCSLTGSVLGGVKKKKKTEIKHYKQKLLQMKCKIIHSYSILQPKSSMCTKENVNVLYFTSVLDIPSVYTHFKIHFRLRGMLLLTSVTVSFNLLNFALFLKYIFIYNKSSKPESFSSVIFESRSITQNSGRPSQTLFQCVMETKLAKPLKSKLSTSVLCSNQCPVSSSWFFYGGGPVSIEVVLRVCLL